MWQQARHQDVKGGVVNKTEINTMLVNGIIFSPSV